jgi:hypothetical protein
VQDGGNYPTFLNLHYPTSHAHWHHQQLKCRTLSFDYLNYRVKDPYFRFSVSKTHIGNKLSSWLYHLKSSETEWSISITSLNLALLTRQLKK